MSVEKAVCRIKEFENSAVPWNIYMENVYFYLKAKKITDEKKMKNIFNFM